MRIDGLANACNGPYLLAWEFLHAYHSRVYGPANALITRLLHSHGPMPSG